MGRSESTWENADKRIHILYLASIMNNIILYVFARTNLPPNLQLGMAVGWVVPSGHLAYKLLVQRLDSLNCGNLDKTKGWTNNEV